MGFYIDPRPLYTCSVCEAPVRVVDGVCHFDNCKHDGQRVHANVGAALIGKGGMLKKLVRRAKDTFGQAATACLGRTVVWR